ncbi:hypothetical protein AAFP35_24995 [Gordonia sp. CPCC 206044]|uniref:hypothetical protein n=1 Tax=Gordonia sp. CPCC 206044 TaxID=3140793 RepID=UPI003AF3D27B
MSDDHTPSEEPRGAGSESEPLDARRPEPSTYFSGERGRSVPKAAWVVLGLALVVLLVVFVARPTWFTEDADDHSLGVPADRIFSKTLAGAGHPDGVWLTDDSPSTSYRVALPVDSRRGETRLHLSGTTQVPDDSTVFLSVLMDGQQVYKQELASGDNDIEGYIAVPSQASDDGQVRVQIRVDGTRGDQTCTPDHTAGMQIHLDPDTTLEAALDEPVHTVRDAVVSWDRDLTVVLADQAYQWRTAAAQLGMVLTRAGHRVTFAGQLPDSDVGNAILVGPADTLNGEDGWSQPQDAAPGVVAGTVDGTTVVGVTAPDGGLVSTYLTEPTVSTADSTASAPKTVTTAPASGGEVPLEQLGADLSNGQITETRRWRVGYSLADLPGGRLPQVLRASFQLPASPPDLRWILNADLNGDLLGSRVLNQTGGKVEIDLPPQDQRLNNMLTLTVQRDRDLGGCDVRVSSYPIQLQSDSALQLGNAQGSGFTAVPRGLAPGFAIYVPNTEGVNAVDELNAIIPTLTDFVPAQVNPDFRWKTQPMSGKPFIVVGPTPTVDPVVRLEDGRITSGSDGATVDIPAFDNGLLVEAATSTSRALGLYIQYQGTIGAAELPDFGTESAQIVTTQGSVAINADGSVVPNTPARQVPPG